MQTYIGAIDQGTTSSRFIIFDRKSNIIASAAKEHRQIYPQPGWVEHDPNEILANVHEVTGAALARANLTAADLAAIGITNQRETTLLWDRKTGQPLANALVWMDTRTDELVRQFSANGGQDRFREKTGLPLATYFSALKLRWLFDQIPGARAAAEAGEALFGTMDTWLAWNLLGGARRGVHVTDVTNASRTMLMNLGTCQWDPELLEIFNIPAACLPCIKPSAGDYGAITTIPLRGTRLAGMLGDQQAALVGQTGTTPVQSQAGLLTTVAYQFGDEKPHYALEGAIAITGALVHWLRDNLGLIQSASEIEALAASVPDNGDVYIVPAFSGLFAPYWQPDARGVITGLTRYANRAHFARAALEATAYQVRDVVEAMQKDSGMKLQTLKTDGGMVGNELLMQFQADMLGVAVRRPSVTETTALGAAYAAGIATGFWADKAALAANWRIDKTWTPAMPPALRETLYKSWQKAVQRSFAWKD
jgi:glycerol kinase